MDEIYHEWKHGISENLLFLITPNSGILPLIFVLPDYISGKLAVKLVYLLQSGQHIQRKFSVRDKNSVKNNRQLSVTTWQVSIITLSIHAIHKSQSDISERNELAHI